MIFPFILKIPFHNYMPVLYLLKYVFEMHVTNQIYKDMREGYCSPINLFFVSNLQNFYCGTVNGPISKQDWNSIL